MIPWFRVALLACMVGAVPTTVPARTLEQQNEQLLRQLQQVHGLGGDAMQRIRAIFKRSGFIGQGNPAISRHPLTSGECRAARERWPAPTDSRAFERICGGPNMAPLYDPALESAENANACIDQYEFPDMPCEYPVVWVRAREAAQICDAVGKRLCDAHEWEGACAGRLLPPDYRFDLARACRRTLPSSACAARTTGPTSQSKRWSYGPHTNAALRRRRQKTPGCDGGGWNACGSNTYPTGAFPECRSALGVYDLHGNAAEHMNLPLNATQMASRGSRELGVTEMKGSWFIFDGYRAHEDWCRWRAPFWHGSRVMDPASHANYHLGFRCCKTLPAR